MKVKYMIIGVFILSLSLFSLACSNSNMLPEAMDLETSIKEIINSKDLNYDLLEDESYQSKMLELANILTDNNIANPEHIALGDLDGDNIPELVIFKTRNPENKDDEGALMVYGFNGDKYTLLDSVSMNYDNTNYQLAVGNISKNQRGIYLNNQVGSHSGITYGFILKKGKLVSILNNKKINLLSIYTNNLIMDIDGDGILEFSVYLLDPETEDLSSVDSDRIRLWYKWNGEDSGTLVKIERFEGNSKINTEIVSNNEILNEASRLLDSRDMNSFEYLRENQGKLSPKDNTRLVSRYIELLKSESYPREVDINNLFSKYQLGFNHDHLFNKYSLSLDRLNDMEYISRQKILASEEELKSKIISNLKLGYKLRYFDGKYHYIVDFQKILDTFDKNIQNEYRDYLKILSLDTNNPYLENDKLAISLEKLAGRIILIENFKNTYPYSLYIDELDKTYDKYIDIFLYGTKDEPHFNTNNDVSYIDKNTLQIFEQTIKSYPHTNFADIIQDFIDKVNKGNLELNQGLKK